MPRNVNNINARLDAELSARGAATFGSVARKQQRLNRFLNYEYELEQQRAELEAARALATLRCRAKRTLTDDDYDGPAIRTRASLANQPAAKRARLGAAYNSEPQTNGVRTAAIPTGGPATRTRSYYAGPAARTRSKCQCN